MPNQSYLPSTNAGLLSFAMNFSDYINKNPESYGLSTEQGADYYKAAGTYQSALALLSDPMTKSPGNVARKNSAKGELIRLTRELVDIVQAFPGTTNDMRTDLRITVRDGSPSPIPVPSSSPTVKIVSVEGRLLNLRLREAGSGSRAKPRGVGSAWIYAYVGDEMPRFEQMIFRGSTTRNDTKIVLPADVAAGSKVWVSACWVNPSDKPGAVSLPVFTWTNHGAMQNAAA